MTAGGRLFLDETKEGRIRLTIL